MNTCSTRWCQLGLSSSHRLSTYLATIRRITGVGRATMRLIWLRSFQCTQAGAGRLHCRLLPQLLLLKSTHAGHYGRWDSLCPQALPSVPGKYRPCHLHIAAISGLKGGQRSLPVEHEVTDLMKLSMDRFLQG